MRIAAWHQQRTRGLPSVRANSSLSSPDPPDHIRRMVRNTCPEETPPSRWSHLLTSNPRSPLHLCASPQSREAPQQGASCSPAEGSPAALLLRLAPAACGPLARTCEQESPWCGQTAGTPAQRSRCRHGGAWAGSGLQPAGHRSAAARPGAQAQDRQRWLFESSPVQTHKLL